MLCHIHVRLHTHTQTHTEPVRLDDPSFVDPQKHTVVWLRLTTSHNVSNNRKATCICLRCYLIIIFILTLDKGNG